MTEKEITQQAIQLGPMLFINSWIDLKKMLLCTLPSESRSKFSVRDPKTKKQQLNKFEERLLDSYYSATGVALIEGRY